MAYRLKTSHIAALLIAGAIGGWMATGEWIEGGQGDVVVEQTDSEAEKDAALFKVRYVELNPQTRSEQLTVRGRTAADAIIEVRTETAGTVEERLVNKGDQVAAGDLVCRIDAGVREAAVAETEAALQQAQFDYDANLKLQEKGYAAESRVNSLKAALDATKARLAQARQELERVNVHANAAGTVQDPVAEVGDVLQGGDVCVTLVDRDPMLFVGQVSEREVGALNTGMSTTVKLVYGQEATGELRYIAPSADPQTRTFSVEVALAPEGEPVRDGVTATATIDMEESEVYRMSPSWLSLSDDGTVGVRTVDKDSTVSFVPVEILSQTTEAIWVSGLEPATRVISLGHDFVVSGQKVEAVEDTRTEMQAGGAVMPDMADEAGDRS